MSEGDHFLAEMLECFSELEADIPGVRTMVGEILIGKIPLTNEVTAYEFADLWGEVQQALTSLSTDTRHTAEPLLSSWSGTSAMSFSDWWTGFQDGLDGASQAAGSIQQCVQDFGNQIELMKFMAVLGLYLLLYTIVDLIVAAFFTIGGAIAGIPVAIAAFRAFLAEMAGKSVAEIAKIAIEALGESVLNFFRKQLGTLLRDLVELSPKKIIAKAFAEPMADLAGELLPDEVLAVLKTTAPTVGDALSPAVRTMIRDAFVDAQLRAWSTAGTDLVTKEGGDLLAQWASRQIGEQTFGKAVMRYLWPRMLSGLQFMGGGNLAGQLFEIIGGERKQLDWGQLVQDSAQGLIMGASMWGSVFGHVVGSAAAGGGFTFVSDLVTLANGGVGPGGKPINLWGDTAHAIGQGAMAGLVFGLQAELPSIRLKPVLPDGVDLRTAEVNGQIVLLVSGDGYNFLVRPEGIIGQDTAGSFFGIRPDGTVVDNPFAAEEPAGTWKPSGPVVEADPAGTVYETPGKTTATPAEFREPNSVVESEPVANEPVASEPVAGEPVGTKPVAPEPAGTKPVVTEPVVSGEKLPIAQPVADPDNLRSQAASLVDALKAQGAKPDPQALGKLAAIGEKLLENDPSLSGPDRIRLQSVVDDLRMIEASPDSAGDLAHIPLDKLDRVLSGELSAQPVGVPAAPQSRHDPPVILNQAGSGGDDDMAAAGLTQQQIRQLDDLGVKADKTLTDALSKFLNPPKRFPGHEPGSLAQMVRDDVVNAGGVSGVLDRLFSTHRVRDANTLPTTVEKLIDELNPPVTKKAPNPKATLGRTLQLIEAAEYAEFGLQTSVEGVKYDADVPQSGQADLVLFGPNPERPAETLSGAVQMKVVDVVEKPQNSGSALAANLSEALRQLRGVDRKGGTENAEIPPKGAELSAQILIVNGKDPLYQASRATLKSTIEAYASGYGLTPHDLIVGRGAELRPILIEIRNGLGRHLFTFDDFIGDSVATQIADLRTVMQGFEQTGAPCHIDPQAVLDLSAHLETLVVSVEGEMAPGQVRLLESLNSDLKAIVDCFAPENGSVRPLDTLERNLLAGTLTKIDRVLTVEPQMIGSAGDAPLSGYGPTSLTRGTDRIVNQHQFQEYADRQVQYQKEIEAATAQAAQAKLRHESELAKIEAEATATTEQARQAMQTVVENAARNLPAKQAALEEASANLDLLRHRMFGEAVAPTMEQLEVQIQAQEAQLRQVLDRRAELGQTYAALQKGIGAADFMKALADAYQGRLESARQALAHFEAEAGRLPEKLLLRADEMRWRRQSLNHFAAEAEQMIEQARELQALVEGVLNQASGKPGWADGLFSGFVDVSQQLGVVSPKEAAVTAIEDALRVQEHFTNEGLTPLLQGDGHLTSAWAGERDALAQSLRVLRGQAVASGVDALAAEVEHAAQALHAKDLALRGRWQKDPSLLPVLKEQLERQIEQLTAGVPEAWRRGEEATVLSIFDDLGRAKDQLAWVDQELEKLSQQPVTVRVEPAGGVASADLVWHENANYPELAQVRQALAAQLPAFHGRFSDLTSEAWRLHLGEQVPPVIREDTLAAWENQRREGYVGVMEQLQAAEFRLVEMQSDVTVSAAEIQAQKDVVAALASEYMDWHVDSPGAMPAHQVGASYADVSVPGSLDLAKLGHPKDWPVAVAVEELPGASKNLLDTSRYFAHRDIMKDFAAGRTAFPDPIGGRLPIELDVAVGRWRVELADGTVFEVQERKQQSLVIDSGPAWQGGAMVREDGAFSKAPWGDLPWFAGPKGAVKLGPLALIGSVGGSPFHVGLQYTVMRRDFYTYEHGGSKTLDITTVSDPHNRFPKAWRLTDPGGDLQLVNVERTMQFYTKWGVQAIVVPMLQLAVGDPAHGMDSLVPFVQAGVVGLAQVTGEVVRVHDAATLRHLRNEWSVNLEWLVGDFLGVPSKIGGFRTHPDVSWLGGWDPNPGTVSKNHVKGIGVTPFVEAGLRGAGKLISKVPWLGEGVRKLLVPGERPQEAAAEQHEADVRGRLEELKQPQIAPEQVGPEQAGSEQPSAAAEHSAGSQHEDTAMALFHRGRGPDPASRIVDLASRPGFSLMAKDDRFFVNAQKTAGLPGYYDVVAHGSPTGIMMSADGQLIMARVLADIIRNRPDYRPGTPIRLLSCNTSADVDFEFGLQLARQLKTRVLAPEGYLYARADGRLGVSLRLKDETPVTAMPGGFTLFDPSGYMQRNLPRSEWEYLP